MQQIVDSKEENREQDRQDEKLRKSDSHEKKMCHVISLLVSF
jgi:hypothetical protein